jgi:ABC-2 type transport system permease protein
MIHKIRSFAKYVAAVFIAKLSLWTAYRLKLVVWIISGIIEPIIWSVLWYATSQTSATLEMTGNQILSYYLFTAFVVRVTRSWTFDTIRKEIRKGRYTKYLLWPKGIIGYRIGSDWATRIVTVSVLLPFWLIWFFILSRQGLFEVEPQNAGLFLAALINSIIIRFLLDLVLGHIALFWTKMDGISQIYWSAFRLLGGVTVPLLLLPDWAFKAVRLMPFRYIVSFPIEVYQGIIDSETIIQGFIISGVWILVELVALIIIFKYGLKNYEAVGI